MSCGIICSKPVVIITFIILIIGVIMTSVEGVYHSTKNPDYNLDILISGIVFTIVGSIILLYNFYNLDFKKAAEIVNPNNYQTNMKPEVKKKLNEEKILQLNEELKKLQY